MEVSRVRARQKVFANADVVCATLSGSGHDMLTSMGASFETVIVDEAAQSIEISSLIPLKFDTQRCILVGDPNQLPPTVMSTVAAKYDYQQSLFMRLEKTVGKEVNLLR
jgi:superfamily I DNA and/or RNA helicase